MTVDTNGSRSNSAAGAEPKYVMIDGIQCELELVKDAARRCVKVELAIRRFEFENGQQIDDATSIFLTEVRTILEGNDA